MKRYCFVVLAVLAFAVAANLHVAEAEAEAHISLRHPRSSPVPNDDANEDGGGGFFSFVRRMLKRKTKKKKSKKKKPKVVNVKPSKPKPCKCNQPEPPNVDLSAVDWTLVFAFADRPPWLLADESEQTWAKLLRRSPNKIIKRVCFKCVGSHQHIYYRRLTKVNEFNPRPYFRDVWQDFDNKLNQDFALYSTYQDAIQDTNRWMYCNYNDVRNGIGFPRDCGPVVKTNNQWNSFLSGHGQKNFEYYIEGANGVVVPPSRPPTVFPTVAPTVTRTKAPTSTPTVYPSASPTPRPTVFPTSFPTTKTPTVTPTKAPTKSPTKPTALTARPPHGPPSADSRLCEDHPACAVLGYPGGSWGIKNNFSKPLCCPLLDGVTRHACCSPPVVPTAVPTPFVSSGDGDDDYDDLNPDGYGIDGYDDFDFTSSTEGDGDGDNPDESDTISGYGTDGYGVDGYDDFDFTSSEDDGDGDSDDDTPSSPTTSIRCDPTGPYKACGGCSRFDETASCTRSEARLYFGKPYCTQVQCCKSVTDKYAQQLTLQKLGDACTCPRSHPCFWLDQGICMGGWGGTFTDSELLDKCIPSNSECPMQLLCHNGKLVNQLPMPAAPTTSPTKYSRPITEICDSWGYPSADNGRIRLYTHEDCQQMPEFYWPGNGECLKRTGGSWSWDCRFLNKLTTSAPSPHSPLSADSRLCEDHPACAVLGYPAGSWCCPLLDGVTRHACCSPPVVPTAVPTPFVLNGDGDDDNDDLNPDGYGIDGYDDLDFESSTEGDGDDDNPDESDTIFGYGTDGYGVDGYGDFDFTSSEDDGDGDGDDNNPHEYGVDEYGDDDYSEASTEEDLVFNAGRTDHIAMIKVDAARSLVCYQDRDNGFRGTCNVVTRSGSMLTKGADLVFSASSSAYNIAVSKIDATKSVVCYSKNTGHGTCTILTRSGDTLTKGADLVFNVHYTTGIAVSNVDATRSFSSRKYSVVCSNVVHGENGKSIDRGICNVLTRSGNSLTKGADLLFRAGRTSGIAVGNFDAARSVVCYRDYGNSHRGTCTVLTRSGNTLTKGADLVVNADSTQYITVSNVDTTKSVVCYRDNGNSMRGTCNVLTRSGNTLMKGADLVFNAGRITNIAVSSVDAIHTRSVLCYQDSGNHFSRGTCNVLIRSGSTLAKGEDLVFNAGVTQNIAVSNVDATRSVVCYSDYGKSGRGTCKVVDI